MQKLFSQIRSATVLGAGFDTYNKTITVEKQNRQQESLTQHFQTKEEKGFFDLELKKTNDMLNLLLGKERERLVKNYKRHLLVRLAGQLIRFCLYPRKYCHDRHDALEVRHSGLFNDDWYLEQNPDLYLNTVDLLKHFMRYGWQEGRNPNQLFDTRYYLRSNPDVKKTGINPLLHFIRYGWKRGKNQIGRAHV